MNNTSFYNFFNTYISCVLKFFSKILLHYYLFTNLSAFWLITNPVFAVINISPVKSLNFIKNITYK